MYIGTNLSASGVKTTLLNEQGDVVVSQTEKLAVLRPHLLWLEQDPEQWWLATDRAVKALDQQHSLRKMKALGVAGQMHGATLLDEQQKVLCPTILWNDGRCAEECTMLKNQVPQSRAITGNLVMPGFTAPKLLQVQRHEPEIFNQIDKVLLPKDYLRLRMTGDLAGDMSDVAGTMWLDITKRNWNGVTLTAYKLTRAHMFALYESSEITGTLLPDVAETWEIEEVAMVAGGGDNTTGAVNVGIMNAGQAVFSLEISGVYFVVSDGFLNKSESAVHSFCYVLPKRWHLMSVMLNATPCLDWTAELTRLVSVPALIGAARQTGEHVEPVWFLPCLSGERTSHNNLQAKGVFSDPTHQHGPAELTQAVLEGVGFALVDGMDVVRACDIQPASITLIGGGTCSEYWRQMLSDISGLQLDYRAGGDVGPALGAARLAQIAMNPQTSLSELLPQLTLEQAYYPDTKRHARYQQRRETFRRIYQQL